MREASFIKQNKDSWLEFEKYLYYNEKVSAERLSELFVQLNNDLAYAQTYYPKSKVNVYLNALASNAYLKVVKPKTAYGSIIRFWLEEAPLVAYKHRKWIYLTLGLFLVFLFMSILSSVYDESFIRAIMGDSYVDMTEENVKTGDPAAVYTNETFLGDAGSFIAITINNVRVGLLMYISGLLLGVGTFRILFINSIMIGSFMTMFYKFGVLGISMTAVWIHGSMEIFAMMIEAAAGLILGLGWLFPGSLTRKQAFVQTGKESLMLVLSTIPFTISAGLLEGFITQYYNEFPIWISVGIILLTLAIISYYYLVYPVRLYRRRDMKFDKSFLRYLEN